MPRGGARAGRRGVVAGRRAPEPAPGADGGREAFAGAPGARSSRRASSSARTTPSGGASHHHHTMTDSKKESFRGYLVQLGAVDALTKGLVALYEEADKPQNSIE